jgi:hypothetical protein
MSTQTEFLQLEKPAYGDSVDIEVLNGNFDKTDAQFLEDVQVANNLYGGRNILETCQKEIASYSNVWDFLADCADRGNYSLLRINDYVPYAVGGNTYNWHIGAFDYDKGCLDQEVTKGSLFMVPDKAFPDTVQWNTSNDNNGTSTQAHPYLASNIYSYLQNTLLPTFPAAMTNVMRDRRALLESRYNASSKLTDSTTWAWQNIGKIWLLSEMEVYGCMVWGSRYASGVETQLEIFKDPRNRIRRTPAGSRTTWWLRCVSAVSSTDACYVNVNGIANSNNTSYTGVRCVPGFLIGG